MNELNKQSAMDSITIKYKNQLFTVKRVGSEEWRLNGVLFPSLDSVAVALKEMNR